MSLVELKVKLDLLREARQTEQQEKRQHILEEKQNKKQLLLEKQEKLQEHQRLKQIKSKKVKTSVQAAVLENTGTHNKVSMKAKTKRK